MLFDRISLVKAYAALRIVENNDGPVNSILFNRTAHYGTKTVIRFKTTQELRNYIQNVAPRQLFDPKCQCGIGIESVYTLLNFNTLLSNNRNISFINNLRGDFESADGSKVNKLSKDALAIVFKNDQRLKFLLDNFACMEYIQNQNLYVNPCEYVEVISNQYHTELVNLYIATTHIDLDAVELFEDISIPVAAPEPIIIPTTLATTSTTQATQATFTAATSPTQATEATTLATNATQQQFTAATQPFTTQGLDGNNNGAGQTTEQAQTTFDPNLGVSGSGSGAGNIVFNTTISEPTTAATTVIETTLVPTEGTTLATEVTTQPVAEQTTQATQATQATEATTSSGSGSGAGSGYGSGNM